MGTVLNLSLSAKITAEAIEQSIVDKLGEKQYKVGHNGILRYP